MPFAVKVLLSTGLVVYSPGAHYHRQQLKQLLIKTWLGIQKGANLLSQHSNGDTILIYANYEREVFAVQMINRLITE